MAISPKTQEDPSYFTVYLIAIMTACIGALIGFFYMSSFPSQGFGSLSEQQASIKPNEDGTLPPIKPGDAFFIETKPDRSKAWEVKRNQLFSGGSKTVSITAGELNSWLGSKFRIVTPSKDDEKSGMVITPSAPNIAFVEDGVAYVNIPANISLFGSEKEYTFTAVGRIDKNGFHVDRMSVGSALIPLPQILGSQLLAVLSAAYKSTEEYAKFQEALSRADSVELSGGSIVVSLQ